jgi:hypothetical protein
VRSGCGGTQSTTSGTRSTASRNNTPEPVRSGSGSGSGSHAVSVAPGQVGSRSRVKYRLSQGIRVR